MFSFKLKSVLGLALAAVLLAWMLGGESIRAQTGGSANRTSTKDSRQPRTRSSRSDKTDSPAHRLREGTRITDELGYFEQNGEGATFVSNKNIKFGGLANLNLERVIRMLKGAEEPENVKWSVSGTVTEFDGRNYLLIDRAVYKTYSTLPAPERISE